MKNLSRLLILLLLLSFNHIASAKEKLLILGDSLSSGYGIPIEQGWVQLLSKKLTDSYPCVEVINSSISGDTTQQALDKFPGLIKENDPAIIIIELGGNDALRGISLQATKTNLSQIIQQAKDNQSQVLLFAMTLPPNYGPEYIKRFEAMYQSLAKDSHVSYVPFFLENIGAKEKYMQADGIHPNVEAQSIILKDVWPYIKEVLPKC